MEQADICHATFKLSDDACTWYMHVLLQVWVSIIHLQAGKYCGSQHRFYWVMFTKDDIKWRCGILEVSFRSLCHSFVMWHDVCLCTVLYFLCACWCTMSILYVLYVKVLMGLPKIPFFSAAVETHSYRRTIQRSAFVVAQLIVPGGVCVRVCVYCMCTCVCTYACACCLV